MEISIDLLKSKNISHENAIKLSVFCAERTINIFEYSFPGIKSIRAALETARKCSADLSLTNQNQAKIFYPMTWDILNLLKIFNKSKDLPMIAAAPSIYAVSAAAKSSRDESLGAVIAAYLDAGYAIELNGCLEDKIKFRKEVLNFMDYL